MAESEKTHRVVILTAGSVNRLLPIPGVAAYAHGFRSIAEAICLRDRITRQLQLAEVAAIRRLMRGAAEDRGPKHRANSWTRRAASRRWLRGILAREPGQLIPLRGGVLSGWCQHPWPGILAAR